MTDSVHSLQEAQAHTETERSIQPPKTLLELSTKRETIPQDQVTISQQARQALADKTK